MKEAFGLAVVLLALSCGVGFGATVRYHGNPRVVPDPGTVPGNAPGPGPFAFPGNAVFLDSSRNQFGIYVNRVWGTSYNGSLIVGKVIRQYLTSSGILEAFTWTNGGNPPGFFTTDPNLNTAPPTLLFPHMDFSAPDRYGFVTAGMTQRVMSSGAWYIRNSGGYGSGLWDSPVQIRPAGELYQNVRGIWAGNYRICVPMEKVDSTEILLCSIVIDTAGNNVSPLDTLFDRNGGTQDYRDGKIVCFGAGPSDGMNLKSSTDGGVTWTADSLTIYAGSPDSGFYQYQNVILLDGSSGVLLTMDDIHHPYSGVHSAVQFFAKGRPKVTIFSPGPGQAACFPLIARKADNTLMAVFNYVPSGWDSVQWSIGRTFWDIGESHSTNGGLTWSVVRNLTNTPTVGECCPQMARFIGTNNGMHITYGTPWRTSQPADTADLYWAAEYAGGAQVKTYNFYKNTAPDTDAVAESKSFEIQNAAFGLSPLNPNPMRGACRITYQLPKPGPATLAVYDVSGRVVRVLEAGERPAGSHAVSWDGRNEVGARVPSGVYFLRLSAGSFSRVRQVVVVR